MCQNSGKTGKIWVPLLVILVEWNSFGSFEYMSMPYWEVTFLGFLQGWEVKFLFSLSLNLGFWKPMRCPGGWLDSQGLQGQGSSPSDFLTAAEMIWGWDIQERGEGIQLQEKGTSVSLALGEISHVLCVIPGLRHSWDSLAHSWGVSWRLEHPPGWEVVPTEVSCYYTVGILEGALTMTMWQWCLSGKPSTFLAMALWWWMFVSPRNWLNVGKRHFPASCASQKTAQ